MRLAVRPHSTGRPSPDRYEKRYETLKTKKFQNYSPCSPAAQSGGARTLPRRPKNHRPALCVVSEARALPLRPKYRFASRQGEVWEQFEALYIGQVTHFYGSGGPFLVGRRYGRLRLLRSLG